MADKSWKAFERHVAKLFGTVRTPLSGGMSGHGTRSDTLHPEVYVEAKHTKGTKSAFFTLWKDTIKKAKREGKLPVLAMRLKGTRVSTLTLPLEIGIEATRLYLAYHNKPEPDLCPRCGAGESDCASWGCGIDPVTRERGIE